MNIYSQEIAELDRRYRANLINTLPGYKPVALVGSKNSNGVDNLAIFNSLIHIGANPPLVGLLFRPLTVPRHTYNNIKDTEQYTINLIHRNIYQQAHQTSAKYLAEESEFDAVNLDREFIQGISAPFVKQSSIKIALRYREEYPIQANGTILLIGEIMYISCPDEYLLSTGHVNHELAETIAVTGLDTYHIAKNLDTLHYAKP